MKTSFKLRTVGLALGMLAFQNLASAQEHVGNGGDPIGMEVNSIVVDILTQADMSEKFQTTVGQYNAFKAKIFATSLQVTDQALPNNRCLENFPSDNKIVINRACWKNLKQFKVKKGIVLHEMLGVTGLESSENYTLSQYLLSEVSCGIFLTQNDVTQEQMNEIESQLAKANYKVMKAKTDYLGSALTSPGYRPGFFDVYHSSTKGVIRFTLYEGTDLRIRWFQNNYGKRPLTPTSEFKLDFRTLPVCK